MDTDLLDRLERLNADAAVDIIRPDVAVHLACDLLVAGLDTPALRELAGESVHLRAVDAQPLITRLLSELDVEPVDPARAYLLIARDVARQMISGDLPAEHGAHSLWSLWTDCELPEAATLLEPLEEWKYVGADRRDAVRAEMRRLAIDVVRATDELLAGKTMNELDAGLTALLTRLNADVAAYNIEPDRMVWLACDLLIAGLDTPALRELAGESPTRLEEGDASTLARQFLSELGLEPMTYDEAHWFIGREVARKILGGAPRAEWDNETWHVTTTMTTEDDAVYAALSNYDVDPGPFLDFVREYVRLADEQLTGWS